MLEGFKINSFRYHITLELQSLSGWSEEVTIGYHIQLILKFVPVIP